MNDESQRLGLHVLPPGPDMRLRYGSDPSKVTSGQNPDVMDVMDVMVTSSRKWVTSSPPESHPESHPVKNGRPPALQSRS